jgi:hypothetical protein
MLLLEPIKRGKMNIKSIAIVILIASPLASQAKADKVLYANGG